MSVLIRILNFISSGVLTLVSQFPSTCLKMMMPTCFKMVSNRKVCTFAVAVISVMFLLAFLGFPSPISFELVYDSPPETSSPIHQSDDSGIVQDIPTHVRSPENGAWYKVPGDFEIYLYTAFYDARVSLASMPIIRIIAVAEDLAKVPPLQCVVNYQNDDSLGITGIRHNTVQPIDIGAGAARHSKIFHEYILNCELKTEHLPALVGIVLDAPSEPEFFIPVEHPTKKTKRTGIAACVSVAYWVIEPYKLVEWLELQRILGIDKVVVYNNSLAPQSARILEQYAKTDFLDFRQSHNFISDPGELTFHLHMSPVINDCMYRYMYQYKNLAMIDFDEIIVPHANNTLTEVLKTMERKETYHPARSYVFRNAYFFFDYKPDIDQHPHLRTLKYRIRQEVSELGYSAKSIIEPISCHAMHNHYCWGVNKHYENGFHMAFVDDKLALLHHYKRCHLDMFEMKPGECKRLMQHGVQDDIMFKYKDELIAAVDKQLKLLGL